MLITKEFEFEYGHFLPKYCNESKNTCGNKHGHSAKLFVTIRDIVNSDTHMVIDFGDVSKIVKEKIIKKLDHSFLNEDVPEIGYPTAENIIIWIWNQLKEELGYRLYELKFYETRTSSVTYKGEF